MSLSEMHDMQCLARICLALAMAGMACQYTPKYTHDLARKVTNGGHVAPGKVGSDAAAWITDGGAAVWRSVRRAAATGDQRIDSR
jgi:hypothetical protein